MGTGKFTFKKKKSSRSRLFRFIITHSSRVAASGGAMDAPPQNNWRAHHATVVVARPRCWNAAFGYDCDLSQGMASRQNDGHGCKVSMNDDDFIDLLECLAAE